MSWEDSLRGKTIIVTGASSGLGRGTTIRLAAAGARVVAVARRRDVLEELADEIQAGRGSVIPVVADVSVRADVERIVAEADEAFGRIHVWVNNVGVGALGYFWDVPLADHARIVEVNLTGVINGAHVAINHFIDHGSGALVNIGSVESQVPLALQSTYAATKAGVLSLSRSLQQELRLAGRSGTVRIATVGWKARIAVASHRLMPKTTERASAVLFEYELTKAAEAEHTGGSLHSTLSDGLRIEGGIRQRMRREDAASRRSEKDGR